jgi:hypothetical protein
MILQNLTSWASRQNRASAVWWPYGIFLFIAVLWEVIAVCLYINPIV